MTILEYVAVLLGVTAGFAYLNHYLLGLPRNTGLLVIGFAVSVCLRLVEHFFPALGLFGLLRRNLGGVDFSGLLLNGFLGFLLFAGALDVDVKALFGRKWTILALATVGVLVSAFAMAGGIYAVFRLAGVEMPLSYCLVFGALISPTDPVMVLGVLRRAGLPRRFQALIAGESLFNDGIGIVLYLIFLGVATGASAHIGVVSSVVEFLREAGGGALLGFVTGGVAFLAMRGIDQYNIELLISLTLVTGTVSGATASP